MKNQKQQLAFYALIFAGIAALASAVLAIIFQKFNLPLQIALGLLVISLGAAVILYPEAISQLLSGRQVKYGTNTAILTIAVVGILIILNLIGFHNTVQWDLTADKTNSLAEETVEVLESLENDVTAEAYFSALVSRVSAENLLRNFKASSNGNFDYAFIDPNENPVAAEAAGITRDGTVVLTMGENQELVTTISEEQMASAVLRLISPENKVIYVLTGHGEPTFSGYEDYNYYYAESELQSKNYTINQLNLLTSPQIPEDAKVLMVLNPEKPLAETEVDLIRTFVEDGGSLLVMVEPTVMTDYGDQEDPFATYISEDWNIILGDDLVIDLTANPVSLAVAASYTSHPITTELDGMVSILPTSRSLTSGDSAEVVPTLLVSTTENSWAETDLVSLANNEVSFDELEDTPGPIALAMAAENPTSGSRMVIFGDAEFANNAHYQYYANSDLFLNAVDWVSGQDDIISLTAKSQTTRTLVTPNRYIQNAILLGVVVFIPLLIIVAAVIVFVKRYREV